MENKLEQFLFAAIGSVITAKEKVEHNGENLKEFQQQAQQSGKEWFDEMTSKGDEEKQRVKTEIKSTLKEAIDELGLATKDDLQQLKKDLESSIE